MKNKTQKQIERRALVVSTVVNCIMAIAGIVVFALTQLQSLFLDAIFSFIAFVSNVMALIFAKISKKRTKIYPTGMYFLEPLYGVLKAVLMFALLLYSTVETSITAYNYFVFEMGSPINILPVLPYTIIMVVLCFGLSFYNRKQNKKINNASTMLNAESKSNLVDGIISGGVGILIGLLLVININGSLGFFHYTGDFFITIILVAISIKTPITLLTLSLRELSGGTVKDESIKNIIRDIVKKEIKEESLNNRFEIYKVGKHIKVVIILNDIIDADVLLRLKSDTAKEIKEQFDDVAIEYVLRKI